MLNEIDSKGRTPLLYACQKGNVSLVKAVWPFITGEKSNGKASKRRGLGLHLAALHGQYEICSFILSTELVRPKAFLWWQLHFAAVYITAGWLCKKLCFYIYISQPETLTLTYLKYDIILCKPLPTTTTAALLTSQPCVPHSGTRTTETQDQKCPWKRLCKNLRK